LRDKSRETAEIQIGTIDPLNRHAKRPPLRAGLVNLDSFEVRDERRASVPVRIAGRGSNVVSGETRNRNCNKVADADAVGEGAIIGNDCIKYWLRVIHQVHFIDREHDAFYAEQMSQVTVPPSLRQHPFARINQDDR